MEYRPPLSDIVQSLPFTVPFVAPEALERETGTPLRLRLGANESSFGMSPLAHEAMIRAVDRVGWYGDPENFDLREVLAAKHGVSMQNVTVGSGLDDVMGLCARVFMNPGDTAITSLGSYPTFAYVVRGLGGSLEMVPYRDDKNDLLGLAEVACATGPKLAFLANPDNPSGSWYEASDILAFREALPDDCTLLLDEAYIDFAPSSAVPELHPDDSRTIRMRTFSKAHGMAGARIGYAIASAEIVAAIDKIRLHFSVNRIAQAGALASLQDPAFVERVVYEVEEGRREYEQMAAELGLRALPSATNFVAIDVGSFERAKAILEHLLMEGVFIRMPGAAPLNRCIRVTVGKRTERQQFYEALSKVIPQVDAGLDHDSTKAPSRR